MSGQGLNHINWFITGTSTGFGRELAVAVLERGGKVAATARDITQIADLRERYGERLVPIRLDVTRPAEIKPAVAEAERGLGGIDVVVNNAGYGYLTAVEEGEDAEIRALFEVNFFGLAAVIRAALPGLRARRRGKIVNISSVGGLVGFPGSGYYAATKFAVEGLSEALAKEVAPLGIGVLIVEPGPFRTDWAGRSMRQAPHVIADYEETAGARRRAIAAASGSQPGDPVRAAVAIIEAVEAHQPPLRLVLGAPGLANARAKLAAVTADLDGWEHVTLAADFPALRQPAGS